MRALSLGVTQTPCVSSWTGLPETEIGRAAPAGLRVGKSGKLWSASTVARTGGRRHNTLERRRTVVVKAASTSTLLFLSALPFAIVAFVWVGVSLMISRIEYDYYEELRELEEEEAERQRLVEQGLAPDEDPAIVGEASTEESSELEREPVGAGKRNRPIREE